MARSALARSVERLLELEQQESQAVVDMAISLRVCDVDVDGTEARYRPETDEILIEVGGRWNRRHKKWDVNDAESVKIVRVPRGGDQEVAARWFAEWLSRAAIGSRGPHWDGFRRVWTVLLEGGRRGGKSYMAVVALCMYAVAVPRQLCWAISPTQEETDELEQAIREQLPRAWYTFRGGGAGKPLQFRLPNGSRLLCLSGHKPRALKRGRVDMALYNEGQNMYRAGWVQLRGAVADRGGLVVITANPPDAEIGRWVEEVHERGRAGKIKAEVFKMTAKTNPFVEMKSLEDMADENDDLTYRREVLGEFVPIGDIVFHAWSDAESVRDVPAGWIDVTQDVTKRHLGRAFDYVIGMDFQATPHMVAIVFQFYRDPTDVLDAANPDANLITVVVDEIVVEDADENDLVDGLECGRPDLMSGQVQLLNPEGTVLAELGDRATKIVGRVDGQGYDPNRCGVVMDASGFDQDGAHNRGRTSENWLKNRGWRWLYKPARDSGRNPDIVERHKVTNSRLKSASGRRRMFVLPHCVRVVKAMRAYELINGVPKRKSAYSHVCDGVSYPIYRFFARSRKAGKPTFTAINPSIRGDMMRGI